MRMLIRFAMVLFHMKADDRSCHLMTKNFQIKPDNLKEMHVKHFIHIDLTFKQYSQATCG